METYEVTTPSMLTYTLRETHGGDDDLWSGVDESLMISNFLTAIIIKDPEGNRGTLEHVLEMRTRDRYCLLLKSRIHNLGKTMGFTFDWKDEQGPLPYEVNVTNYVWDYGKEFPEQGSELYFDQRIIPYPTDMEFMEKELSTGRRIRMKFLDGYGEVQLLKLPQEQRTMNKQLKVRNLELWDNNKWVIPANYMTFSSREMGEIRGLYQKSDVQMEGLVRLNDSFGTQQEVPLLALPDFYFPALD